MARALLAEGIIMT